MKKALIVAAALLVGVFSASAQLSIGKKSEGIRQLATLQQMWSWLYLQEDHYYFVTKTDNQFDDWMWLDLGGSKEEAKETVTSLIAALEEAEKGNSIDVESRGEKYLLICDVFLGMKSWNVHAIETRRSYAGTAPMNMPSLRKALKYFEKE